MHEAVVRMVLNTRRLNYRAYNVGWEVQDVNVNALGSRAIAPIRANTL